MSPQALRAWDLRPVDLADRTTFDAYVGGLQKPLSDYTFAQIFGWRDSLGLWWRILENHLCVFANGSSLTLLLPPMAPPGTPGMERALKRCFEVMDDYNAEAGFNQPARVEGISDELLARMSRRGCVVTPLSADYVYDVTDMIELAGGAFRSKRHDRNHFLRSYAHRVESWDPARHVEPALALMDTWKEQSDADHDGEDTIDTCKRGKEALSARTQAKFSAELGLKGLAVYVGEGVEERLAAYTLGEPLGADMHSVLVEKTDREVRGLAQFIYSEFCRVHLAGRPLVNAGDDWGLEGLAKAKMSYRPVQMLAKYAMTRLAPLRVFFPKPEQSMNTAPSLPAALAGNVESAAKSAENDVLVLRFADVPDLPAAQALEQRCFSAYPLSRRQLRHLQQSSSAVFVLAERTDGTCRHVVGECIGLMRRHHRRGQSQPTFSGRIYTLAVDANERGRGIGRLLLEKVVTELTARGARRIFLEVAQDNAGAITLYEHFGFRAIGTLPDYYGDGLHALHMVRTAEAATLTSAQANSQRA